MKNAVATKTKYQSPRPTQIKFLVAQIVAEVLVDPDFGMELTPKAKKRLRESMKTRGRTVSFSEIKAKYF